ncbi:hypothetical protein RND81_11G230200 [Saponaria officinalis]|uniref:U-box domain-containing protein n=1 Tax=Saponaria officinalis TaxID=3572 RepID=A0AAW1HQE1_SAPOF
MVKKDLCITIPTLFKCPISLDVMKSPVSLSTGVTYDRATIQRWLDAGNTTCPATMQVLTTTDFVPNHTLHRLIQTWSNSHKNPSKPFHSLSSSQAFEIISRVSESETRFEEELGMILCFASESLENSKLISSHDGFVRKLCEFLATQSVTDFRVLKLFEIVTSTLDNKHKVRLVFDQKDILHKLLSITSDYSDEKAEVTLALSCLISLCSTRINKIKLIEAGTSKIITKFISKPDNNKTSYNSILKDELVLTMSEMLVGCKEGRAAIMEDPNNIQGFVGKLMSVSKVGNEHAIALLWSLCCLFRDQKAREAIAKCNGGLTKMLLLMQSDCSPAVKRMCCDLIRVFRVNSKSCLSSYDTKNTHIMPY